MSSDIAIITAKTISDLLNDYFKNQQLIEEAYTLHGKNKTSLPHSSFLRFPEKPNARIIALPAFVNGGSKLAGIKWIASFPDNIHNGLPRANAVILLNDYSTGIPFACMEGTVISATRTAASAVLAAYLMNNKSNKSRSIGFMGTGVIAKYIYDSFIGTDWEIEQINLCDLNEESAQRFKSEVCDQSKHQNISIASTPNELIRNSDIIVFATTSAQPYIHDLDLFRHHPMVLHISLRDLGVSIIENSINYTDDIDHVLRANTSLDLTQQKLNHKDFIQGELFDLINTDTIFKRDKPLIFSPFGLGILDLILAQYIYLQAKETGNITDVDNFFSI